MYTERFYMNTITPIQNVSFAAHHGHSQRKAHFSPITIANFHYVDDTLLRGSKPNYDQLKELKNNGVKNIISFCTNYNPKTKKTGVMPEEADLAKKLNMNFFWIPFKSTENPSEEDVKKFFSIIDKAKQNGEKVFIHCRYGSDRTGLFSALYRVKYQKVPMAEIVKELMAYGHDANHNPNIVPFIINFKESLSPINKFKNVIRNVFK